ncbi:uncharacterized protein KGF55_000705 [Candida pseudojiufengensis]|uniref:uncharacterized protein n=1 Tax=Candida pseudojiufengensis TaxID=497109 RepID=UPI0022240DFD|nr:uncharacterized protein KGF55_000705 [Candida pseudojiufengensis]KAI5966396.1 hypothetical protein KGF55_000705 [Candida pseudojiufengensis]
MYQQIYYGNHTRSIENLPPPLQIQPFTINNHQHNQQQNYLSQQRHGPLTPLDQTNLIMGSYFTPTPTTQFFTMNNSHQIQQQQHQQQNQHQYSQSSSPRMGRSRKSSNNSYQFAPERRSSRLASNTSLLSNESNGSINGGGVNNTIDQITASRTIILKNLSNNISLNELLNHIEFGPIELIKLVPNKNENNNNENCYISFVNSKVSLSFLAKFNGEDSEELNKLRKALNSEDLEITMNEYIDNNKFNNYSTKDDNIKLKVLNYILEYQATRCLKVEFRFKDLLPDDITTDDRFNQIQQFLVAQCEKFGDIEEFKLEFNNEVQNKETIGELIEKDEKELVESDSIKNGELQIEEEEEEEKINYIKGEIFVHFTSIESSIRAYENYSRRIQNDLEKLINKKDSTRKNSIIPKEINDVNSKFDITYRNIKFGKDRCDRTVLDFSKIDQSSLKLSNSTSSKDSNDLLNNNDGNDVDGYEFDSENSTISDEGYSMLSSSSRFSQIHPIVPQLIPMPYMNYNVEQSSNNGNRSIYLGNLHPNTTIEEIANNVRAGGLVESICYYPEKKMCFITFIDPAVAYKFYTNHQVLHQLVVHGYDVTVGWAKQHSGPLSRDIALAVTAGASRNVYLGVKTNRDNDSPKPIIPNEDELRNDFSKIGELEQINFYHNKDCAFLNFLNIAEAIKVVDSFNCEEKDSLFRLNKLFNNDMEKATTFYNKYKIFKISFAKDRCGNPPKFSFRKKLSGSQGSTYQQYQDQLHASVRKHGRNRNKYDNNNNKSQPEDAKEITRADDNEALINDEAAMVFGIIKDMEKSSIKSNELNGEKNDETTELTKSENKSNLNQESIINGVVKEEENEDDEEEDESDDDEDVSIIIGSDETTSTNNTTATGKQNGHINPSNQKSKQQRPHIRHQKIYHNQDTSFSQRKFSRNSSNISINSSSRYNDSFTHHHNHNHNHHPQSSIPPSPYMQPQPVYFLPQLSRTSSTSSFRSNQIYQPSPNPNLHGQPVFVSQPSSIAIPIQQSVQHPQQQQFFSPNPQHQHHHHNNNNNNDGSHQVRYVPVVQQSPQIIPMPLQSPQYVGKSPYTTSGSQVMAQYLANTQQQERMYGTENNYDLYTSDHHNDYGNDRRGSRNRKSS